MSKLTIEFGSRKRGERALQTSWMAPSSDHVAAMMGSMYFLPTKVKNGHERWRRGLPLLLEEQVLVCKRS